jgi:hypothetical protein
MLHKWTKTIFLATFILLRLDTTHRLVKRNSQKIVTYLVLSQTFA